MSLPLLHAGKSAPGLSAALDLRFALDKSLTAYRGPTPSFSRASTGSYFDGSGVLRYATLNLCLQSGFASGWSYSSGLTATPNSGVAPDGTNTALKIYATSSGSNKAAIKSDNADCNCVSWYAKAAGKSWTGSMDNPPTGPAAWFNLSNGTVGTVQSGYTASIQSVGNGWYRCCVSKNSGIFYKPDNMVIYVLDSDNSSTITANGTDGILIWGPQAELKSVPSATPGTYIPTTSSANSAPRFDHTYNGTSWVSRGLLVEEQRTNAVNYSEDFSDVYWGKSGASVTANSTTAPDGNTTADKFVENSSTSAHVVGRSIGTTSGTQTWSFFAKAAGRNWIAVNAYVGADARTWFNLDAGTVGTNAAGSTATIQNVGNGWYRCSVSRTGGSSTYFDMHIANSDNSYVYTGDGTSGVFVWGAQLEVGSFPTSYIGTTSSSVVRSADVCQITGTDFSGFWNAAEGSVVAEYDRSAVMTSSYSGGYPHVMEAHDGSTNNRFVIYGDYAGSGLENWLDIQGGSLQFLLTSPAVGANTTAKLAGCYKVNDSALSFNGAAVTTDTSCTIPTVTRMTIGYTENYAGGRPLNGHIARLRYFNKRLPNATLQLLSEPDPTLNLQFALNKTLTPVAGPAPSFSRASTGTYFNASGVLTNASINTPRFDHVYSGGQWVSRGLLVEEQRTNICLQSNTFNTTWLTLDGSVSANAATSPDGTNNAWKLNEGSGTTASHGIYQPLTIGTGNYTWSVYAKAGERSWLQFLAYSSSTNYFTWFNLANGTVGTNAAGTTASIQDVGGGWYRCSVSRSTSAGTSYAQIFAANADNNGSYTGDPTKGIYIYGCQVEAGSFPTSYIGTTTSSVTRSADVCQITGTSFNWMWNQGEGSVASEFDFLAAPADRVSPRAWYVSDGAYTNGMWVQSGASDGFYVYQSGSSQAGLTATALGAGVSTKVSSAYKLNDFAASFNGASALTDTTGNVPTVNRMEVGFMSDISGRIINGHIAKLIYYPARLTNTKLQQLST